MPTTLIDVRKVMIAKLLTPGPLLKNGTHSAGLCFMFSMKKR
jgi:hypothetical protein